MSLIDSIVARLEAIDPPVFAIVDRAGAYAELDGAPPLATPAAYVMVLRDASGENERATGPVMQRTEADVGVVIITSNLTDAVGGAAAGDVEALKTACRAAVIGFQPEDAEEPMEHVAGEIVKVKGGTIWHEEVYSAAWYTEESSA